MAVKIYGEVRVNNARLNRFQNQWVVAVRVACYREDGS